VSSFEPLKHPRRYSPNITPPKATISFLMPLSLILDSLGLSRGRGRHVPTLRGSLSPPFQDGM